MNLKSENLKLVSDEFKATEILLEAIRYGDVSNAQDAINNGADINVFMNLDCPIGRRENENALVIAIFKLVDSYWG